MKQKTSLILIEQTVMLLVLAVAAALCLRVFAWSDARALENQNRDQALQQLQSAAEVLKQHHGDFSAAVRTHGGVVYDGQWYIDFDDTWVQTDTAQAYQLRAVRQETRPYYGSAFLEAVCPDGSVLAAITVSWQEVAP